MDFPAFFPCEPQRHAYSYVRIKYERIVRFFPTVSEILCGIGIKIHVPHVDPIGKDINPSLIGRCWDIARCAIEIVPAFPCVRDTVVSSGGSNGSRMTESEILSYEFEHLDVSETISASHMRSGEFAHSTDRSVGIGLDCPSKICPFRYCSFFYEIQLLHSHSSGECTGTGSRILIIVIAPYVPVPVLVSQESS